MRWERQQKGGGSEKDWAEVHKPQCSSEQQEVHHLARLVDLLLYILIYVTELLTAMQFIGVPICHSSLVSSLLFPIHDFLEFWLVLYNSQAGGSVRMHWIHSNNTEAVMN